MALRSWVPSAAGHPEFPLENLPLGVFVRDGQSSIGAAIGDEVLDLRAAGILDDDSLAPLMSQGRTALRELRTRLTSILTEDASDRETTSRFLVAQRDVQMQLPCAIGDYTDFYASIHHATNVGSMFRPDNPLLPNYKWVPIGYHGRASSIVVSGTPVRRPSGQTQTGDAAPVFGPAKRLDYEMEVGMLIGRGNDLGDPVDISDAEEQLFGLCLVNDWSARDVQTWEYQPLGPFLSKSFATTISPWIVSLDALEPFRVPPFTRAESDPQPLPHLAGGSGFSITVEVWLQTAKMREPFRVSRGNFSDMYWTIAQLIAHHTSNGCNLRPGDLLASGTISGAGKDARGCMLERTWRGTEPLELPNGEQRQFLEDGDEVILRGYCETAGQQRIGFGECRGIVLPAR